MCKNLKSKTTEDSILALFRNCGEITDFNRPNHEDGTPKNFCFIEFETSAQAL